MHEALSSCSRWSEQIVGVCLFRPGGTDLWTNAAPTLNCYASDFVHYNVGTCICHSHLDTYMPKTSLGDLFVATSS